MSPEYIINNYDEINKTRKCLTCSKESTFDHDGFVYCAKCDIGYKVVKESLFVRNNKNNLFDIWSYDSKRNTHGHITIMVKTGPYADIQIDKDLFTSDIEEIFNMVESYYLLQ